MVIPLCGTFDYKVVVPDNLGEWRWEAHLRAPVVPSGDPLRDDRLFGYSPIVEITPAGITPDPGNSSVRNVRPRVLRSRITFTASEQAHARTASAGFYVDHSLTAAIRPHDVLFVSRTSCGGLGLSLHRDNQLVVAVGAVTAVPLGDSVRVRIPGELIKQAEDVFRLHDPEFEFGHLPVEIEIDKHRRVVFGTRSRLGAYDVFVEHGFYRGLPGTDECVAISLPRACPDVAAIATAQLLDYPDAMEERPSGTF